VRESFEDVVIEPQRAALIPGFADVRRSALSAGALGCSISGAGPATFAWCLDSHAHAVCEAMVQEFAHHGLKSDHWITPIAPTGARVVG
jgi:homoserine kinase